MSAAEFTDDSGIVRLKGTLTGGQAGGIPQGGPLTQDLQTDSFNVKGSAGVDGAGNPLAAALQVQKVADGAFATLFGGSGLAGAGGASATLQGGSGDNGNDTGAAIGAGAGDGAGNPGTIQAVTGGSFGMVGQALVATGLGPVLYGGVQVAAAPPAGDPTGLPLAVDTTAVTGGLYVWNGAAWVKVSTIP